jgi:hypothetical protein
MPAPSLRSTIAGVGSILDFASKRKQQIAVYKQQIAVYGATFALMAAVVAASAEHNPAVEEVGQAWACAKAAQAPHLSHSGHIEADIEADIQAAIDAAHDTTDEVSSCKKAVDRAKQAVEMAKEVAAKLRLPEKETAELLDLAEKHPQPALKLFGALAREAE